jgi:hypothetical protein
MLIDIMNVIYDWVNAVINNPDDPGNPNLPIIPSHSNIPAPDTGPYLVIDYSPSLEKFGGADWETIEVAPDVFRTTLRTDYEGTVEFWECNGIGDYLYKLVNSQWIPEANDYLRENNISFLRNNEILTIPSLFSDEKWRKESVLEIVFGFGAGVYYETGIIEHIEATGTLTKPDGTERIVIIDE